MTDSKYEKSLDRQAVLFDAKQRIIDLAELHFPLPTTDIYDEPVRYFKANLKWTPIIFGFLGILEDVAAWEEAEGQNYAGIQAVLTFEEGITVIENCADVEDCLSTSDTISAINDSITEVISDTSSGGTYGYKESSVTKPLADSPKLAKFTEDLVLPSGGCNDADKDKLWAIIVKIVFSMHAQNSAFLADIAASTDFGTASQNLAENVPLSAAFAVLDAVSFIDDIFATFKANYDSAVTEAFLYDVCADLFCAATDCQFSFQDFADYVASNAGGTFDIATTTFLDVAANLFGQSTGAGIFYALSWLQIHVLSLGEKFMNALPIESIKQIAQAAKPDSQWLAYASACYTHSGAWTVILDFAGDYVKTGSEFVYRMSASDLTLVSGNDSILTQKYLAGMRYAQNGGGFTNKKMVVSNVGALFQDARINWRKISGTATMQINVGSNLYTPPNNTTTNGAYFWDTYKPLRGVGSPVGSIAQLNINWSQNLSSASGGSELRYVEIRGTGELPIFT